MTPIDTATLRALIEACEGADQTYLTIRRRRLSKALDFDTVRALCDGYDEAQRLRARTFADYAAERYQAERDAARQALADLVADLQALVAEVNPMGWNHTQMYVADLRAVIDRHAPEEPR